MSHQIQKSDACQRAREPVECVRELSDGFELVERGTKEKSADLHHMGLLYSSQAAALTLTTCLRRPNDQLKFVCAENLRKSSEL